MQNIAYIHYLCVMLNIEDIIVNPIEERCIVIWDGTRECVIFDPGCLYPEEKGKLDGIIRNNALTPKAILITHGHFDHVFGAAHLQKKYGIPAYMSPEDAPLLSGVFSSMFGIDDPEPFDTTDIHDGDVIRFGSHQFDVITTPGHSRGSVVYYCHEEKLLISGDTLFAGAIGRTDLPGGDYDRLMESLKGKVLGLAPDVDVLPGHGPATTIADEIQKNPFLLPFNEPEPAGGE